MLRGKALTAIQRHGKAEAPLRESIELFERQAGRDDPRLSDPPAELEMAESWPPASRLRSAKQ